MHFDEVRPLNYPNETPSQGSSLASQQPHESTGDDTKNERPRFAIVPRQTVPVLKAAGALETANDRLQELMQLFYLLSRDPAIPQDARYHVTLAQSEITLLTRVMQNVANQGATRSEKEATG